MDYVADLHRLAQNCHYGDTLQERLRDRIFCGINDDWTQRRLLAKTGLTFEKALQIAISAETANKNARDLQAVSDASKFYNVVDCSQAARPVLLEAARECYQCRGTTHMAPDCRFR